jgi:uncharacterized Zn finger protein
MRCAGVAAAAAARISRAAKVDGVDAVVDVLARNLCSASQFQRICQELTAAGRVEQALEWARRGLAELQGRIDHGLPDLRRLAASLHAQMGRQGEAVELAWQDFAVVPSVEGYQRVREYGEADGSWARWRQRALNELRQQPHLSTPPPPVQEYTWPRLWVIPYWSTFSSGREISRPRGRRRTTVAAWKGCG